MIGKVQVSSYQVISYHDVEEMPELRDLTFRTMRNEISNVVAFINKVSAQVDPRLEAPFRIGLIPIMDMTSPVGVSVDRHVMLTPAYYEKCGDRIDLIDLPREEDVSSAFILWRVEVLQELPNGAIVPRHTEDEIATEDVVPIALGLAFKERANRLLRGDSMVDDTE